MKYIKRFENLNIDDINIGDILYCINNKGVELDLKLGEKYTIDKVYLQDTPYIAFRLKEIGSSWMSFRFTKDPNHPVLVELNAKKYNL